MLKDLNTETIANENVNFQDKNLYLYNYIYIH